MARPHSFTPEKGVLIVDLVEQGNWYVTAARRAGVTAATVRNWVKEGMEDPEGRPDLAEFATKFQEAAAEAEAALVQAVRNGCATDPDHAKWLLEKRFWKRWSKQATQRIEMSGPGGGPIRTAHSITGDDFVERVMAALSLPEFTTAREAVADALAAPIWPVPDPLTLLASAATVEAETVESDEPGPD